MLNSTPVPPSASGGAQGASSPAACASGAAPGGAVAGSVATGPGAPSSEAVWWAGAAGVTEAAAVGAAAPAGAAAGGEGREVEGREVEGAPGGNASESDGHDPAAAQGMVVRTSGCQPGSADGGGLGDAVGAAAAHSPGAATRQQGAAGPQAPSPQWKLDGGGEGEEYQQGQQQGTRGVASARCIRYWVGG